MLVDESSLEMSRGPWSQEAMILLTQKRDSGLEEGVWRGEGLGRGSIWAFWPPS